MENRENPVFRELVCTQIINFNQVNKNFTPQSQNLSPNKVVNILNKIFISFDNLAEKFSIEKYSFDPAGPHWGRDPDLH